MKVLITGINGQLGRQLKKNAPSKFKLYTPSRDELDFLEPKKCFEIVEKIKPDWVINSAAFTNVDLAEKEFYKTMKINFEAPFYISKALKKFGGNLLQLSTDYVFDGNNDIPYNVLDKTNPINTYGESKLKGEKAIIENLRSSSQVIVLRTSWIISPYGKNFVLKILELLRSKDRVKIVSNQIGTATSAKDLSIICWEIIESWERILLLIKDMIPILHFSNDGLVSWFDIANAISEISSDIGLIKSAAVIEPISSNDYSSFAKRPNYSALDNSLIKKILNLENKYWYESLREILLEIKKIES